MISSRAKKKALNTFKYLILSFFLIFLPIKHASGQSVDKYDFERIEDNSYLIEEAYNQDPGIIQHISTFQLMKGNTWLYTFTDEWPVPGRKHQLSATIPLLNSESFGLGDIALNYRFQAIYKPRYAFSPRFSVILPTGNSKKSLGAGVIGYQVNLPFSFIVSRYIVTHYNAGITLTPNTSDESGLKSDQTVINYGFSIILLLKKNFNFMFEAVGNTTSIKSTNPANRNASTMFINPGIRYAINFKSGLQIVPGMAIPIGLGPSSGEYGIFGYLSFEHPLKRQNKN
jgi:hypothetical protein